MKTMLTCSLLCAALGAQAPEAASAPTFTEDIAPIVFEHCASCHRPDDVAPLEEAHPGVDVRKRRTDRVNVRKNDQGSQRDDNPGPGTQGIVGNLKEQGGPY